MADKTGREVEVEREREKFKEAGDKERRSWRELSRCIILQTQARTQWHP